MERGNWLKFGQNDELAEILLSTRDKTIVEASPSDKIVSFSSELPNTISTGLKCSALLSDFVVGSWF